MLTVIHWMQQKVPNEEAREIPRELKGTEAPYKKHQYELTSTPRAPWNYTTNQRKHRERVVSLAEYVAEDCLVSHQWEERPLVLQRFYVPVQGNARTRKREWVG